MQTKQTRILWSQFKQQESIQLFTQKGKTNPSRLTSSEIIANPFGEYSLKFIFKYVAPPQVWGLEIVLRNFLLDAHGILLSWSNLTINGCRLFRCWNAMIDVVTITDCGFQLLFCCPARLLLTEFISVIPLAEQCPPVLSHETRRVVNKL